MSDSNIQKSSGTGSLSLKERQRQERLELILQATEKALLEKGYHEMSLDEIAAQVGIAKATIYLHFPSKEELVISLVKKKLEQTLIELEQIVTMPVSARKRLLQMLIQAYKDKKKDNGQLFFAILSGSNLRKEVLENQLSFHNHMAQIMSGIGKVIEDGKAGGEINPALSTDLLQSTFLALLANPGMKFSLKDEEYSPEDRASQILEIFFNGVGNH
jgi:AcrR family transcriptional regulator